MAQPLVAVQTDVKLFENYTWHAAPQQYLQAALSVANVFPVLVPSLGAALDMDSLLDRVDGVMITGSRSNVHPSLYGQEATEENGPYDEMRDATSLPLIRAAIKRGVPLLAICRGLQELNVALGGTLASEIQEQEGVWDHRAPNSEFQAERFAIRHPAQIKSHSCLAGIFGKPEIMINSVHRQAIGTLANGLAIEASTPDGIIEAVSVEGASAFAIGVQWHPEYWAQSDENSARLFRAFGEAASRHAEQRKVIVEAAE